MDRRLVLPLLAAATLAFACGPRPHRRAEQAVAAAVARAPQGAAARRAHAARRAARSSDDPVHAALVVDVTAPEGAAAAARFALAVVNEGDHRLEVNFPDGRTRDFAVYDAAGREVWRWSRGRLFTQVMQNKLLGAQDSTEFDGTWKAPAPGRYTVVAELRSDNHPARRVASFVVPAPLPDGAIAQAAAADAGPSPVATP